MKILITGANGYLGQGVVKALLDNGHSVVAADFKTTYVDKRAEKIDCDLFSVEDPYTYFGKPDVLLHLAWRDGFVHYSENHIADLPKHYHFLKQMVDAQNKKLAQQEPADTVPIQFEPSFETPEEMKGESA